MDKAKVRWLLRIAAITLVVSMLALAISRCGKQSTPPKESIEANTQKMPAVSDQSEDDNTPQHTQWYESTALAERKSSGNYRNDALLKYEYDTKGNTISLGLGSGQLDDYIYLNPRCSEATPHMKIGFYISSSRIDVEICDKVGEPGTAPKNASESNVLIVDRTYDTLVPAIYKDPENYGIRWKNDPMYDGNLSTGTTLYIRAVRLFDGYLVAICRAEIVYDQATNTYRLASLYNADVRNTGELPDAERDRILNDAVDFIRNPERGPVVSYENQAYWDEALKLAKIERRPYTYFDVLYDKNNKVCRKGDFVNCDVYAVNVPLTGFGFVSVYYAPGLQLDGFNTPTRPGSTDLDLQVFGYDAFFPFRKDTLLVVDDFWKPIVE
jgi:hypothetical protein